MLKLQFKDRRAEPVWLVEPGLTIGRDRVSGLVLEDDGVNGFHADVRVSGNDVLIEDVGSPGGTFVNDTRIDGAVALHPGDVIRIGSAQLVVVDPMDETSSVPADEVPQPPIDIAQRRANMRSSPPPSASGWALRAESGPLEGKLFPLDGTVRLGRSLDCQISIPEARLSREHAELEVSGSDLVVRDLQSSNGTYHNDQRVAEARLQHGDSIAFDTVRFKVVGPSNDLDKTIVSMAPIVMPDAAEPSSGAAASSSHTASTGGTMRGASGSASERAGGGSGRVIAIGVLVAAVAVVAWLLLG